MLFANAGGDEFASLGSINEDHFDKTLATNVKGVLYTVQEAQPLLSDGGSIIPSALTTASMETPAFSAYSATKAAVRSFARNRILDLREWKIRVNAVNPGPIGTPGLRLNAA